ncbi:YciI family protein [Kribbella sp. CA-294648]|uniref:YciI family protein n=1 Tax=Kribbella sp. CA-294648 TaxID=3239948 RepID=UPI003D8F72E0
MRYLLVLRVSGAVLEQLTAEQREAVQTGHRELQRTATEAGELIGTETLADPSTSTIVHTQNGRPKVSVGHAADEFMSSYYLVDVDNLDRALELANLHPATRINGLAIEIRPVMSTNTTDL